MDWFKTLILTVVGLSAICCSHFPLRKYFYISSTKTWEDAQLYCREKYTDLATFESIEEINQLNRLETISGRPWIGLHDDPMYWKGTLGNESNSWRWSTTGNEIRSEYHNWSDGEPNNAGANELCVNMGTDAKWNDGKCWNTMGHICYTDMGQNQKTYVLVSESRTWEEAQDYCRQHYTDLAVITSSEENAMAQSVANNTGWIGLYRNAWAWSDMSPVQFTNWLEGQPNNAYDNQHFANKAEDHKWLDDSSSGQKSFICHEVRKSKITVRLPMKSTNNLSDPALHEEILQKISATFTNQGWTHFKLQWRTPPQKTEEKLP